MRKKALSYESGVVPVSGIHLAYHAFGRRTDPAFLLIIGLGTQMVVWDDAFCRRLMRRGYYVIRFDNRDVGLSAACAIADIHHVQHGAPGSAAADTCGAGGSPYPLSHGPGRLHRKLCASYSIISGPVYPINEARVRRWVQQHFENGLNPVGITRQLAAILYAGDRTAALHRITAPTLVLHGDADPLLAVACAHTTADAIPGARLKIIPGMGHVIPDVLWDLVVDQMVACAS